MANGCIQFFLLCWFAFLFLTGLTLFTGGFLLKRIVVQNLSTCSTGTDRHLKALNLNQTVEELLSIKTNCWLPARFNKAIILIIDGLRYDFIKFNESVAETEALPFQNKFTFPHELLKNQPEHSALFQFMADPPTTTMQRIKGLITGSLPTFIDISSNFASAEITEDNIIDQLIAQKKRVTFLGDDTWMGILPNRFQKSFPFPSFNVKDLHTVDNGIVEHLVPERKKEDWDVIVAHFLGVDHCGHRYGPYHDAMAKKLNEMNDVLRSIVDSLDSDTVLFLMGDHGMTKTGDHGGDSIDEISSALFVYSKKKLWNAMASSPTVVRQMDFAPTFSLLMGIPIPFGNLGRVIFNFCIIDDDVGHFNGKVHDKKFLRNLYSSALALYTNVKQVEFYLEYYNGISQELAQDHESFLKLQQLLNDVESLWKLLPFLPVSTASESLSAIQEKCITYLNSARDICQKVWAQFDCLAIIFGLCISALSLVQASGQVFLKFQISLKVALILFGFALSGSAFLIHSNYPLMNSIRGTEYTFVIIIALISSLLYFCCALRSRAPKAVIYQKKSTSNADCKVMFILGILSFSFLFSNSFVINEASISSYFTITILWWEVFTSGSCLKKLNESKRKSKMELLPKSRLLCIIAAVLSTICIRTVSIFWKCREEQWWCGGSAFLRPLANIPADTVEFVSYKNWRFFISVCSVLLIVVAMRWLIGKAGNMNGFSPAVLCASYTPVLIGICICSFWALQVLSATVVDQVLIQYQIILPNVVFLAAIVSIPVLFLRPLCIYTVRDDAEEIGPVLSTDTGLLYLQVYRHLKANWRKHFLSTGARTVAGRRQLMVYGLASAFSAPLITVVTILLLTLMLVSSDGLAPAFLLLIIATALILYCLANLREDGPRDHNDMLQLPWSWVLLWSHFASVGFYATGHQQTFPALHWESATIGTDGNIGNHVLPAVKVLLNTFSSTVLAGVSLPLLLLWPFTNRIVFDKRNRFSVEMDDDLKKGEFYLFENPTFFNSLYHLTCKYIIIQGAKLFFSMAAAALLRRHLMVWKIFAPRFLFEAVNFLLTIPAVLFGFLLMMSVHAALVSWMKKLEQHEHKC